MGTPSIITDSKIKQPVYADPFRKRLKRRSDKLTNQFLIIYFLGGVVCAFFNDTWLIATGGGCIYLLIYYSVKIGIPETNLYQYVLSSILGLFMAQYIYQMQGMFEVCFFAFIGSTVLIMYQNWKLQIPLFIIVVVHLSIFGYHQNSGFDNPYFANLNPFELQRFILHILLAALIFFICGLWSYLLKKYTEIQIVQTKKMETLQMETLLAVKEQAAIESNTRFSYAAQATSDAIWDRNYTEDKVFWGDGYYTLFGYDITPETASVSFWASKVHPEDISSVTRTTLDAKENPSVNSWVCEYRFLKANDEYAYVKEKAIILRNENGIPCRTIGALQDISETKLNEFLLKDLNESLEKEKYYLDSLMDNMPDAIYFKDKESKFLRVSKYMVDKHLAHNPDASINDLLGKSDFDFKDKVHAAEAYQDEQEIQQTRKPKIDYIEKETRDDGSERWVATTKLPLINPHGEVVGTFGMSRDITKLKILEKQQHEAQLDKAVMQGKSEIASDVMHDIGNAVVGFGSYLTRIKRLQEKDNSESLQQLSHFFEEQKPALITAIGETKADAVIKMLGGIAQTQKNNQEDISKSITEQLKIIANIEEILSIQRQYISGHESKERKPANLKAIINDSLSMLFTSVDKLSVNVSLNIADNLPLIKGDRTKLMQLLLNVLKNSIEDIETNPDEKTICINAYTDTNKLVVQVKDNGSRLADKSSGTNHTLNTCRAIVESHEGTIDITSEGPGKGTLTTIGFKILAA